VLWKNNPLEELLSSASVVLDRGGLAACLKPYIIVGSEGSHEIVVLDSLFTLPNRLIIQGAVTGIIKLVLSYLIARQMDYSQRR
jgi:hypothetical protein